MQASLVMVLLSLVLLHPVAAFAPPIRAAIQRKNDPLPPRCFLLHRPNEPSCLMPLLYAAGREQQDKSEDDDVTPETNPYADPNYPDLEFVNYSDPEYAVDMGTSDEFYDPNSSSSDDDDDDAEQQVEAMREERRRRNDEYQFQTYYQKVLRNGEAEFRGEWTVYETSTFMDDNDEDEDAGPLPQLVEVGTTPLTVVSRGYKEWVETDSPFAVDAERIRHVEEIRQPSAMEDEGIDGLMSDSSSSQNSIVEQQVATEGEISVNSYWPDSLKAMDFRGHQGIMVCGK